MSSKTGPDLPRASWSLAARLTAWNAGASFALILAATAFLYWALARSLDREDDQQLADKVRAVRAVLVDRPGDSAALRREVEGAPSARPETGVYVRLLGPGGRVEAETPGMGNHLSQNSFPDSVDEPGQAADLSPADGKSYRVLAVRVADPPVVIQAAMDRTHEVELLAEYRKNIWVALGAAGLLCALGGYWIARRGLRPIRLVTATARRIRPDHLGERIEADGLPAELLALADTFNHMLDRLERSFARLARFSADIAHELRTPVNNLRGEVEVALGRPRTPDEYRDVLGSALEECGRLARLIDTLLFLARAEHPETQVSKERVEVGPELATVCEFYEAAAAEKGVKLIVTVPDAVQADVNRTMFQRAVENLVANAVAHTPPGGTVTLTASGDGTSTTVEVADTGSGIPADHLPYVFDRFYRADPARPSAAGRVGLGLAIVKSIMDLHGGDIRIASEVRRGTRVSMSFARKMTKP